MHQGEGEVMHIKVCEQDTDFLDLTKFKSGEDVLFCIPCKWQTYEHLVMKPICPKCGRNLMIKTVREK